ncbi:anion permease [Spirochaetia bacterium]|nr:anion permease [Spirochaetia bacterium]
MNIFENLPWDFSPWQIVALVFCGICIGMSKTGFSGITTVIIPFMALIFGAKESTGVMLPMLCFADLLAVIYYRRSASWKYVFRLVPWALGGFAVALLVDRFIPPRGFKMLIGSCILAGLVVMVWNERRGKDAVIPTAWWFSAACGVLGGFTTMIGNAAGPIMSVFLLSMRLPKTVFVGTAAWFFLIVNYLKLPIQHFAWHNISRESLILNLMMVPIILAGALIGVILVKKISEAHFRIMILVLATISTILLFR